MSDNISSKIKPKDQLRTQFRPPRSESKRKHWAIVSDLKLPEKMIHIPIKDIFSSNLPSPVIKTDLLNPDERIERTAQLVYSLRLIHDGRLALLPAVAANEFSSGSTSDAYRMDVTGSGALKTNSEQAPEFDEMERAWIRAMAKEPIQQEYFQWLVLRIVEEFIADRLKDPTAIAEVIVLGPVLDLETYRSLLSCLISTFQTGVHLDVTLLQGLVLLIESAPPGYIIADDMITALVVLQSRLDNLNQISFNYIYQVTRMIHRLLDVAVGCGVQNLNLHKYRWPMTEALNELSKNADPFLQFQGNYALQVFQYADDEPILETVLRFVRGVTLASLEVGSVCKLDSTNLLRSLDNLRQAAGQSYDVKKSILEGMKASPPHEGRIRAMLRLLEGVHAGTNHEWCLSLLAARSFVRDGRLADFSRTVCGAHCRDEIFFQFGVCQILGEIAMDQLWNDLTRQHAIDFLSALYRGEMGWKQDTTIEQWIFTIITQASDLSEPAVRDHALVVLQALGLDNDASPTTSNYPLKFRPPLPTLSPLLARVQNIPYVENNLQELMLQQLKTDSMSGYIPLFAKANFQASDDDGLIPLMDKVNHFLASDGEILLILGDSGSGKSTFNRYLEGDLWKRYTTDSRIPLFINLPTIEEPEKDMIGKQLREHKFSPKEIQELKRRKFVVICDGYDESQLSSNIYTTNLLNRPGEWKAKLIITCRTQHLDANHKEQFVPKDPENNYQLADDFFQEVVIAPFSKDQIKKYIDHYVHHEHHSWSEHHPWSEQDYLDKMKAIPNLMDLVRNPFLLHLVLKTLPTVVHNTQDASKVRVSRVKLYDVFVEDWVRKSKDRLMHNVNLHQTKRQVLEELIEGGFEGSCISYQETLVAEIFQQQGGKVVVDYNHKQDKYSWKARFFGPEPEAYLLRDASLLNRAETQFSFKHRSLFEYFFSRLVAGPTGDVDNSDIQDPLADSDAPLPIAFHPLSWGSLINEPSIIQFLCDRVQQSESFKKQLLKIVERSKTDLEASKAAANAVTILFKSGVPLYDVLLGVRIPGADLSGGELDAAQFQGADLTGVNFSRSWLRQTDFSNAIMTGVQFGEWPFLSVDKDPTACAYSGDGSLLAVGLSNGVIIIYDTVTWKSTCTLFGHAKAVTCLVFSPQDNSQLFSASRDESWGKWDLTTEKPELVHGGHGGVVASIVISPDGQQLATGGFNKTVRLWSSETLPKDRVLGEHSDGVTCLAYSPDGSMIASGSSDTTVRLWDTMSEKLISTLKGHSNSISSIAFASYRQQVVSGSHDATVRVWDMSSGEQLHVFSNHSDRVSAVAYSKGGQHIVSASWDRTVRVWDSETQTQVSVLRGATRIITGLSISPNGLQQVAACSNDKTVRLWDATPSSSDAFSIQDLVSEAESSGHTAGISTTTISPDGKQLATGGFDMTIRTCDASNGYPLGPPLCAHKRSVAAVAFSPNGQTLASASWDHSIRLWDTDQRGESTIIRGHLASVTSLAFLPSGELISGSADWTVCLWDLKSPSSIHVFKGHTRGVRSVACSLDGSKIVSGSEDYTVRVWKTDVRRGGCEIIFKGHEDVVACVIFSPTGYQIASASEDKTIRLWDTTGTTSEPKVLHGHQGGVQCVAYSSCGMFLASGGDDNKARVWNASSGSLLTVIGDVFGGISSIVWRKDELRFVIGCKDGSIRAWRLFILPNKTAKVQLEWGTGFGHLVATDACIDGVIGLSKVSFDLLKQRGAIEKIAIQSDTMMGGVEE
ncbi:WD_REPEATS_REGION domain-containing protein [Linnemannia zychae]|nr:WD_REPEATS_REGION domain-containing protein [Linnemannia zychae]